MEMQKSEKADAASWKLATSFRPIGVAARLVTEKLARGFDSNRAYADLENGSSQ
jgi:hypothetical protein